MLIAELRFIHVTNFGLNNSKRKLFIQKSLTSFGMIAKKISVNLEIEFY